MRLGILAFVVTLLVTAALAAPAQAELRVSASTTNVQLFSEGTNGFRVIIEHFADGTRNGIRVRQIGLGDPRITSSGDTCFTNLVLNDVVCDLQPLSLIETSQNLDGPVEMIVGGSNVGCDAGDPVPVFGNLTQKDDIVRPRSACGGQESSTGDNRLSARFSIMNGLGGNDSLTGGRLNDHFNGDGGDDTILGGVGPDTLNGGDGNDTIRGQGGDDMMTGGNGADVLDGGGQNDTLTYAGSSSVTVTLDGSANDGRSGEGDNVTGVETIITGAGNDRVTGSSANETFDGGSGNDTLIPGTGTDTVRGGFGDDLIDVRETSQGIRDVVTCGTGFDEVIADLADSVLVNLIAGSPKDDTCERVERFAVDDGPPGRIRARSVAIRGDGGLTVPVFCPRRARVTCSGTLRLADNRRLSRTLARAAYRVPRGSTIRVGLRLSREHAARARARRAITAITRERGVSKKGPRSSVATLSVSRPG